jgi:hypothetical protein
MRIDEYLSPEEIRLMQMLKGKNRMEMDEILYEYERKIKNGNTL